MPYAARMNCDGRLLRRWARRSTSPEDSVTDFGPQLFELRGALLQAPFIDRFNIEAPVTANLETGNCPFFSRR